MRYPRRAFRTGVELATTARREGGGNCGYRVGVGAVES